MEDLRDPITSEDVKRFAQRCAIKRVSDKLAPEIRRQIDSDLTELCYRIAVFLYNSDRSTVQPDDVRDAAKSWLGIYLSEQTNSDRLKIHKKKKGAEGAETRKFKPGTRTAINIRHLQKSSELIIRRAPLGRMIRETLHENRIKSGENNTKEFKIGKESLLLIQGVIEDRIVRLLQSANLIAKCSNRETVKASDVRAAVKIRSTF